MERIVRVSRGGAYDLNPKHVDEAAGRAFLAGVDPRLDITEVAKAFDAAVSSLYAMGFHKAVPSSRLPGDRVVRYRLSDAVAWFAERAREWSDA
jgi:hypothetical protein